MVFQGCIRALKGGAQATATMLFNPLRFNIPRAAMVRHPLL
jgi:hypothetical protein